ncbi:MAG: UDP-glucose/GDP-mannose dehydrogenase family protein, partial [Alphaproteobacteria bacterium]|nr:UDP-glucose/GDP-mannose dehydrogenase family protein [Alphaproteobacteria bacterium]
ARGIGLDGRIGRKFLHPGPGYGGSCFPKDTLALAYTAREAGSPITIVEQVIQVNSDRKKKMAQRVIDACGGSVAGKTIGVLGLAFKPNTDDMRDAPSLDILPALRAAGAKIQAYDPAAMTEAARLLNGIDYKENAYEAAKGADCLVVLTEWTQFRALDPARLKQALRAPIVVDLRNIFSPEEMRGLGFTYECVGRPQPRHSA